MTNLTKSLYIHIPFCEHLCDYCDFTKLQYFRIYAEPYIDKLIDEIESYNIKDLETIYVGGGTPTSLEDDLFDKLFTYLSKYSKDIKEFTVECNPESLTESKLQILKNAGVNRLSLGIESTDDNVLKAINRRHTFNDIINAISLARTYGFNNIAVDLILGLPNVTLKMLEKDIYNILSLNVEHISTYSLTVHENTVFGVKGIKEPSEEYSRLGYDLMHEILTKAGYEHYEISSFAIRGRKSRHNLTYWKNERYYGCGLAAAGYIDNFRYKNTRNIIKYLNNKDFIEEKEYLTPKDIKDYYVILNLRTNEGISLDEYQNYFNEDFYLTYQDVLDGFIKDNLLVFDKEKRVIFPTYEGFMILDSIIIKLI